MEASDSSNNRGRLPTLAKAPLSVTISCRNEALTIRSLLQATPSKPFFDHHRARCIRNTPSNQPQVSNAVSRRNARERKRVKLVNLGFANLRDHVPAGTKTKKLSKVETLRAAINYIRQLQGILGDRDYGDILSPSTTPGIDIQEDDLDDNSSTSEEGLAFKDFMKAAGGSLGGSENTMSPASSTESSLVHSPYGRRDIGHEEPQLMDISSWFT